MFQVSFQNPFTLDLGALKAHPPHFTSCILKSLLSTPPSFSCHLFPGKIGSFVLPRMEHSGCGWLLPKVVVNLATSNPFVCQKPAVLS